MSYLSKAIKSLHPEAEFSFNDADYSTVNWIKLEGKAPTQAEIDIAIQQIKNNEIALANEKSIQRQALLNKLGITAEEAQLLLGGN